MTWCGRHPAVARLTGDYTKKVRVPDAAMAQYNARLGRSETLPKYIVDPENWTTG
jgi:hypothetical protein